MKFSFRFLIPVLLLALPMAACQNNAQKKKLKSEVDALEAIILSDSEGLPDRNKALELIQAYENYANALPADSLSPEFLFRGAEIAMNLQMSGRAIEYHQRIINTYPDYGKVSYCRFLQAFIYENQMQQFDTARRLYEEFLEMHPDHPLADDARVSILNMGKSIEEIIESWESQEITE